MLKKLVPEVLIASRLLLLTGALWPDASRAQTLFTNTYTVAADDFANPERGFYLHTETRASNPSPVPANLANLRLNGSRDPNNAYVARISLVLRVFYLDAFINAPISSNYLNIIQADLDSIRNQGAKVIVRFAYFRSPDRPFPEPGKAQILEHIGQLAPILRRNRDVIAVLQQGFIGAWGEGYYTDVFSTAGQTFTAQNWRDRAEVIQALLEALPPERMIQVRVPQQRQKFLHGPTAPTSTPASAAAQEFNGSAAARLGFHNDCFLADTTDSGTFGDYDGATDSQDITRLRDYKAQETRFTAMGGETCLENSPADNCAASGGRADTDLALFHYSFLNQGYNANVNDDWVGQGCMEDIKRRLGYRMELVSGVFPGEASPGQAIPIRLELRNTGFAAPFNPRGLELVLRHTNSGQEFFAELSRDTEVRRWLPGTNHLVNADLGLPLDLPPGGYELLLHLPDPTSTLYGLAHYSIRLANSTALHSGASLGSVWEPTTGYHRLGHTLLVNGPPYPPPPVGTDIPVLPYSAIRETYETWRARNFPPNSSDGDPDADPDTDGWRNLVEYAVGTNPNSQAGTPVLASLEIGRLVLTLKKPPGVKDVAYEVEGSPSLAPDYWSTAAVTVLTNSARILRARLDAAGTNGFLRLRVRLTAP